MRHAEILTRLDREQCRAPRSVLGTALTTLARGAGERSTPLLSLRLLTEMTDMVRHIVLTECARSFPSGSLDLQLGMDVAIHHDFVALARTLGLTARRADGGLRIADPYLAAVTCGPVGLAAALERSRRGPLRRIHRNNRHVRDLVAKAASESVPDALQRDDVRYLLTLARYLEELDQLSLTHQVAPTFGEHFYSDLGELAYDLYTRTYFERLCQDLPYTSFLDIGCGEGRYLETAATTRPDAEVVGLELQTEVAASARRRVGNRPNAAVENVNVLTWRSDRTFDVILTCYMLFYLSAEDRRALFRKIAGLLSADGTLVVCQYFPDVAPMREIIIRETEHAAPLTRWLAALGGQLCAAEVLLNRCLLHFRTVVYWEEMLAELAEADLEVHDVAPAEALHYSYFVQVRRRRGQEASALTTDAAREPEMTSVR